MKKQNMFKNQTWRSSLLSGSTAVLIAASVAVGISMTPDWVNAQETTTEAVAPSQIFTSPLDGVESQDPYPAPETDGERGDRNADRLTFLAEALGITADELSAARDAARDIVPDGADGRDRFEIELAHQLGLTEAELDDAQAAARDAALNQAIADGQITAEEAAERQAQAELRAAERELNDAIDRNTLFADALDMTQEEFDAAIADGTSVRDLAAAQGLDNESLRTGLETAYSNAVQQAVTDGVVTQEHADAILADDGAANNGNDRRNRGRRGDERNRQQNQENGSDSTELSPGENDDEGASQEEGSEEEGSEEEGSEEVSSESDDDTVEPVIDDATVQQAGLANSDNENNRRRGPQNASANQVQANDAAGDTPAAQNIADEETADISEENGNSEDDGDQAQNNNRRGNRERGNNANNGGGQGGGQGRNRGN